MSAEPKPSFAQDLWDRTFFQFVATYHGVGGVIPFADFLDTRFTLDHFGRMRKAISSLTKMHLNLPEKLGR